MSGLKSAHGVVPIETVSSDPVFPRSGTGIARVRHRRVRYCLENVFGLLCLSSVLSLCDGAHAAAETGGGYLGPTKCPHFHTLDSPERRKEANFASYRLHPARGRGQIEPHDGKIRVKNRWTEQTSCWLSVSKR